MIQYLNNSNKMEKISGMGDIPQSNVATGGYYCHYYIHEEIKKMNAKILTHRRHFIKSN